MSQKNKPREIFNVKTEVVLNKQNLASTGIDTFLTIMSPDVLHVYF